MTGRKSFLSLTAVLGRLGAAAEDVLGAVHGRRAIFSLRTVKAFAPGVALVHVTGAVLYS